MKKAKLILDDGEEYIGESFGFNSSASGEVVFNTGMTGYPQSLTDPSYAGQILVFTYPLIGNYGVGRPKKDKFGIPLNFESRGIHVKSVIVSEYCERPNHWDFDMSIKEWLIKNKIPAISGIDTRALAIKLRSKGVMLGRVIIEDNKNKNDQSKREKVEFYNPDRHNLVQVVSRKDVLILGKGKHRIVVVDCGIKNNILRCLLRRDTTLIIVPWDYDFNVIDYDGLFISNGPGNPEYCSQTISNIKFAMKKKKPIFGICLGNQLVGLAAGAQTYKLKFGHRSQNQPCINKELGIITSQNHGFAIDAKTLPKDWVEFFINANDGTNEGIKHKKLPFFTIQFHPEGYGGPYDSDYLFDDFIKLIEY